MSVRVSVLHPQDLSSLQLAAWRQFLRDDPLLASPFLEPEFTQLVAAVRQDVRVAVIETAGVVEALIPFQQRGRVGLPVGGGLSDCQAVIAPRGWNREARAVVRAAGLGVLNFTQARAGQCFFGPHACHVTASPVIGLGNGFDDYAEERRRAGSSVVSQTMSHTRRLERRLGSLRFVLHDPDPRSLHRLIAWKREQYSQDRWGGALDLFSRPWTVELLERIHRTQEHNFAGVLSTLWAGDTLIAAHMGMRCPGVLHYWFPAYDGGFAKLAPGRILLLEMIRHAAATGISRIELGAGDEGYKTRFANTAVPAAAGFAGPLAWQFLKRLLWQATATVAGRLPIGGGRRLDEVLFRTEWQRNHE